MDMNLPAGSTVKSRSLITSRALQVLVVMAVLFTIYLAQSLILPIVVAGFIALFASPLVQLLMALRLPRPVASVTVVAGLVTILGYLFSLLIDPALRWLEAAPVIGDRLIFELSRSDVPIASATSAVKEGSAIDKAMDATLANITSVFAQSTIIMMTQLAAIIIITYFFLTYGEDLMRSIVKAQANFSEKKLTVVMFQSIRYDVSNYVLVVTLINIGLGLATAGALTLIDFEDALLWGALATTLNYAPYVGPLLLAVILTSVGFAAGEPLQHVFIAPGIFLVLNLIESQFVTPTVLGKRFNINPLLVVLWMFIWGWIWGPVGMLLAIPILVCFKLVSTHLNLLGPWVEIFNGAPVDASNYYGKLRPLFAIFTKKPTDDA